MNPQDKPNLEQHGSIGNAEHDWEGVYSRLLSFFAHRSCMEPEDLTQETMSRIVEFLNEGNVVEGDNGFLKFAFGCARNVLSEHVRQRLRAEREVPVEEAETKSAWSRDEGPERRIAMREALRRLPDEERSCLIRAELESANDLAAEMEIPLRTLRVKVFRARARLREFMNESRAAENRRNFSTEETKWAGGQRVTLAIVFSDMVQSTALNGRILSEAMNAMRRAHFARSSALIARFRGREIKTMGDSFMTVFRSIDAALDYGLALWADTGHRDVRIRVGIHTGPMQIEDADVFGGTVNYAARVIGAIQGAEIWVSDRAKADIDGLGTARHRTINWNSHDGIEMKGFGGSHRLWSIRAESSLIDMIEGACGFR